MYPLLADNAKADATSNQGIIIPKLTKVRVMAIATTNIIAGRFHINSHERTRTTNISNLSSIQAAKPIYDDLSPRFQRGGKKKQ